MIRVWPVIHLSRIDLAVSNARIAQSCGARGVFLIHMDGLDDMIGPAANAVLSACPQLKRGANFLSLDPSAAVSESLRLGLDATWSDRPGVRSDGVSQQAKDVATILQDNPGHEFFASVAFKYQPIDPNPGAAAIAALGLGFIPTTSGAATGCPPDVSKLEQIRQHVGPRGPLALASGVDPFNAALLAPYLSDILVSTGIAKDFYTFDEGKLGRLMSVLRR